MIKMREERKGGGGQVRGKLRKSMIKECQVKESEGKLRGNKEKKKT